MRESKTTQEWVNELKPKIDERLSNGETFYATTAPTNSFGWDYNKHEAMAKLRQHYLDEGCSISSIPKHGVTDWRIMPKVVIPT